MWQHLFLNVHYFTIGAQPLAQIDIVSGLTHLLLLFILLGSLTFIARWAERRRNNSAENHPPLFTDDPTNARYVTIGVGNVAGRIYHIGLTFGRTVHLIGITSGSGHAESGGFVSLQALLKPTFTSELEICDCLWLRDVARAEQTMGRTFTAQEILDRRPEGAPYREGLHYYF